MSDASTVPARSFVTGASGLLGSRIVTELLAGGGQVTALVRDTDRARRLLPDHPDLVLVSGDVTEPESYLPYLGGNDVVFHTAAYFREYYQPGFDLELLRRTNVTAVENLLLASAGAGVPTVVHTSSTGVLGGGSPEHPADEDDKPTGDWQRNAYRASKVDAEEVVHTCVRRTGQRVPLILPGWMWGPGDAGPTAAGRLFLAIAKGELAAVPAAGNHLVDARDVAIACVRAAAEGESGRRYVVAGTWHALPDIARLITDEVGVPARRTVPVPAALTFATVLETIAKLRGQAPIATRTGVKVLVEGHRKRYTSARAEKELGIGFRPLAETIADEAAWYRTRGMLPAVPAHVG
ncbi:NAD-dependent epimerase/dehydratase family protein [Catenuloplanes sp. NPDC051500]|uniref:NAD-dependent epimerase/dehydratase family protein n=1 Tax=Catenuloplanes sp. NPDC051500 TaxID=3363959 RepID=UPI003790DED2